VRVGVDEDGRAQSGEDHPAIHWCLYPDGSRLGKLVLSTVSQVVQEDVVGVKLVNAVPALPVIQCQIKVLLPRRPAATPGVPSPPLGGRAATLGVIRRPSLPLGGPLIQSATHRGYHYQKEFLSQGNKD
jgi:hypothetical protein